MKVSIIMSVYNTELYVAQAIDSVIAQTFTDWELIIVNDGSTDKSTSIINSYNDARIKIINKKNSGQADSRNIALSHAQGELVAFIDSDDWYEPNYLEHLVRLIEDKDVDIAICGYYLNYKPKKVEKTPDIEEVINADDALIEIIEDKKIRSFLWDKLFKRQLLVELMPVGLYYEDYSTVYKWFMHARKVGFVSKPLYNYRQRKSSTDHNKSALKNFHFFSAELNRFEYLKTNNLLPQIHPKQQLSLVKCAVRELKHMARNCSWAEGIGKYRNDIISAIKPYISGISLTTRFKIRLWLIMHAPKLFYLDVKFSGAFVIKKESNKNLYD